MAEVIRMPRMSDTMEEGVIVGWLKQVGDAVEPGDVLAEVETDKATMELESFQDGVLLYIGVKEGAVPVNGILAVIGEEGEDYKAALAAEEANSGATQETPPAAAPEEAPKQETKPAPVPTTTTASAPVAIPSSDTRIKASPLAKSMAQDSGVNLSAISGSGDNGRIIKRDIEAYLAKGPIAAPSNGQAAAPTAAPVPQVDAFTFAQDRVDQDQPVSQMRKVIARRLGESKFGAPHFYLTMDIDMTNTIKARKSLNEVAPVKISFNDLVVKASAAALRKHPAINSSWLGDSIRQNGNINIGVAVAVPDGLLVPVVRYADMKSLSQINVEVKDLAGKAKNKKLQPAEMTGNTFTISNLGMFGIDEFTAIINPPDACILAVGGIAQKPVVKDGNIIVGNMMKVTLSCDHRVVDGATGAKFLQTLKGMLEDPIRLLA
ncbi:MAG: pyruvate dehydrogenase E2 component (dihydrolipoamide acetyltransferase) [Polaribacter sp.]|jgi:pyruvate dehydrogenase E2 component (dihydrolipoamide acetyltransferase)